MEFFLVRVEGFSSIYGIISDIPPVKYAGYT